MKLSLSVLILLLVSCTHSQINSDESGMANDWPEELAELQLDSTIVFNPKYRFQMVFTPVVDGEVMNPISYNTDHYFYPASLVKIPVALMALEKMERNGIGLDDYVRFDTVNTCGSVQFVELCTEKKITFRQMFTELFVVSDNHFYNALYHFVTPGELNAGLHDRGYTNTHIFRAFTGCDKIDQLHTYAWKVYNLQGNEVGRGPDTNLDSNVLFAHYSHTEDRMLGSKHENSEGEIVDGPYDLNYLPEIELGDLQEMMLRLLFPDNYLESDLWNISQENRTFIIGLMRKYPSEIKGSYRKLDSYDDFVYKYARLKGSRTTSKMGLSYGFASETAYIEVPGTSNGFLLSYSVYVNGNDVVNDGKYEYEEVARVFAEKLAAELTEFMRKTY